MDKIMNLLECLKYLFIAIIAGFSITVIPLLLIAAKYPSMIPVMAVICPICLWKIVDC